MPVLDGRDDGPATGLDRTQLHGSASCSDEASTVALPCISPFLLLTPTADDDAVTSSTAHMFRGTARTLTAALDAAAGVRASSTGWTTRRCAVGSAG